MNKSKHAGMIALGDLAAVKQGISGGGNLEP